MGHKKLFKFKQMRVSATIPLTNVVPNIVAITSDKGEATRNLYMLFAHDPSLFEDRAQSLMYVLYAGAALKANSISTMIGEIVSNRTFKRNENNEYANDGSILAMWARVLKNSKNIVAFEPVFNLLNNSLDNYLKNMKVSYNDKLYDTSFFKPLCYDRNGNNYYDLLPYVAYLSTFFISGRPYTFSDNLTNASQTNFSNELEKYYMTMFAALKRDHDIDLLTNDLIAFGSTNKESLHNMIRNILEPNTIMQIRDEVLKSDRNVYRESVETQNELTQEDINIAFQNAMDMIISIIVAHNPIKESLTHAPPFRLTINSLELANLTEYALSGGYAQFLINDTENYTYDYSYSENLSSFDFFGKQMLSSDIKLLKPSVKMPFTAADPYLKIVSSYVKNRFDNIHDDPLGANDIINIKFNESDLKDSVERYSKHLIDLIAQAIWLNYSDSLHDIMNINNMTDDIEQIKLLPRVINTIYDKSMAAVIIPAYILSRIPHHLLIHVNANQPLKTFKIFEYYYAYDMSPTLLSKLNNVLVSLIYIDNIDYCKFVNVVAKEISDVLEKSYVLIPYVKGLDDCADAYAIGGIELYKYATAQNPFVRSFAIVRSIMGTCEKMNYYASVVSAITNNGALEVAESGALDPVLSVSLGKLSKRNLMLMDYNFKNGIYSKRKATDIMDMKIDGEKITNLLSKYMFKSSNAESIANAELLTRRLVVSNGKVSIEKISKDDVSFGTDTVARVPVYDMNGIIKSININFGANLKNRILVQIEMFAPSNEHNMMAWVFSNYEMHDRFTIKTEMEF